MAKLVEFLANNQCVVTADDVWVFQSYNTVMVVSDIIKHEVYIRDVFESTTTSKYVNRYLKEYVNPSWTIIKLNADDFDKKLAKLRKTKLFRA